jgi:hypothetical protein
MHKPLKGTFADLINAVADGNGTKQPLRAGRAAQPKGGAKTPKPKK